jgi:hypothetical protein
MRKLFQLGIPVAILSLGTMFSTVSFGKPEYTKKEKKACTYCHVKAGSKDLNDAGKYYAKKHTLEGYTPK